MTGSSGEWPTLLQEAFTAAQRGFRLRFRGYDRHEVDRELREATERLTAAVEDADAYVELAAVLDEQVAVMRALLAEYDRLHAGEEVCGEEDPATRDAIARARREAAEIVEDARRDARLVLDREERAIASRLAELEDAERESRRGLVTSTAEAADVLRDTRSGCERLLARLLERQRVLDEWTDEFADLLDDLPSFHGTVEIPLSRKPEEAGVPGLRAVEIIAPTAETTPAAAETAAETA